MEENRRLQKFSRVCSEVEPSFWHKQSQLKLDVDRLNENERNISGHYTNRGTFCLDVTAFNSEVNAGAARGILINKNTIETFRNCDKDKLLQEHGQMLEGAVASGEALENPSLVVGRFILLTFADLKKCHFYYWFAFLAPKSLSIYEVAPPQTVSEVLSSEQVSQLTLKHDHTAAAFTIHLSEDGSLEVLPLAKYNENALLGFYDSGTGAEPSWPLRSLLWLIACSWPEMNTVKVLCIRRKVDGGIAPNSHVLQLSLDRGDAEKPQWVGWERNEREKLGPRLADLAATMDPVRLAESAVDLNLRLMKWRLLPDLELDVISNSKCLLLGAGTLGCGVARGLMAWGVRQITLLDAGRVSFSNPVRQSLFLHRHCLAGGAPKASAAAESLCDIFPGVVAKGIEMSIPMPGHTVAQAQRTEVKDTCEQLESLITSHDVIFLLTDTRESRWLPTLLAKIHGKIVINAALGFDSFLVMRHGTMSEEAASTSVDLDVLMSSKNIPGYQLGCYFCNDVVAPRNSTGARTLDQQCTVVRPGVAQVAAALAVELMVSVLQHPQKGNAAASCDPEQQPSPGECLLGLVPHSIRGFLAQFQIMLPASHAFPKCAACSPTVMNAYQSRGFDFLLQAFDNPGYLEELTGLAELQKSSISAEVWALSDSEEDAPD